MIPVSAANFERCPVEVLSVPAARSSVHESRRLGKCVIAKKLRQYGGRRFMKPIDFRARIEKLWFIDAAGTSG
jgi:hypothetical protein